MSGKNDSGKKAKKSQKRTLIEWGVIIVVAATLYLTGYHTEVIGLAQRGLLATGLMQPDYELNVGEMRDASGEFYFADTDFKTQNLSQYRGKVVFLNIWASWCPPCIAEMPSIEGIYQQFKDDEDVKFLLVSVDENFEDAQRFVESRELDLPIYHFRGKDSDVFSGARIPTTYVITPGGKIAMVKDGMAKYDTPEFADYINELKKL